MTIPDTINGAFELFSSFAVWWNVWALYKDKAVKGVRILPMAFFTTWGFWNLYYYPHLGQVMSFLGGAAMTLANCVYIVLMRHYLRKTRTIAE